MPRMENRILVEVNGVKVHMELSPKAIEAENMHIRYQDIKSLHTKNSDSYFLRMVDGSSTYLLKFDSVKVRDLIKNIIVSCKSPSSDSELKIFVQFPSLLKIFYELNVSQVQFLNYYKSSFFYNIKNEKNAIDRLMGKTMGFPCNTFASRINSVSLLNMHHQKDMNIAPKSHHEHLVDFEPIYPETKPAARKKLNDFSFKDFEGLCMKVELEIEAPRIRTSFEIDELMELRKLRRDKEEGRDFLKMLRAKYRPGDLELLKRIMPNKDPGCQSQVPEGMPEHEKWPD